MVLLSLALSKEIKSKIDRIHGLTMMPNEISSKINMCYGIELSIKKGNLSDIKGYHL